MLAQVSGVHGLMVRLAYGSGLRLMECLRLRVKDVDLSRREILVRDGKGAKDRVTMLPSCLVDAIRVNVLHASRLFDADRAAGRCGVYLPHVLERKCPAAGTSWPRFWLFLSDRLSVDPRSGIGAGIMRMKKACSERSRRLWHAQESPSPCRCTRCAIPSPRICWSRVTTSIPCRNYSVIWMCRRP